MSEQFDNAMMLAMDAYNANNEEECKNFCNQALTVDPKSANAKALKGAAVLISFSLAGAESDAVEAIKIWNSISDTSSISDEYKDIVVNAAFDFRTRWYKAADEHYSKYASVKGSSSEWSHVKKCCGLFMDNVAQLPWLLGYKKFLECTLDLVKKQFGSLQQVTFAETVYKANLGADGEVGSIAKQIEVEFDKLKNRRLIKWCVIIGCVIVGILIIGANM